MFAVSELEIIHVCSYSPLCLPLPEMFLFNMSALKALLRKLKNSNHQPIPQIWLTYNYIKRFNPAIVCDCPKPEPGYLTSSLTTHTSLSPIRRGFASGFVNYKKGALDSQPQVIKFTSCLPMVCGSLRVLLILPPLKLVAMI